MNKNYLPPLRQKIQKALWVQIAFLALAWGLLSLLTITSIRVGARLIYSNYDSIAAATRMHENIDDLAANFTLQKKRQIVFNLERNFLFIKNNITIEGEKEIVTKIEKEWKIFKEDILSNTQANSKKLTDHLDTLVRLNEKVMTKEIEKSRNLSRWVYIASPAFFILFVIIMILRADKLANKIAQPLKDFAESLRSNPDLEKKLSLPEADTLELLILRQELGILQQRLSEFKKVNVDEIVLQSKKLESILESVEDGILVINNRGEILHTNRGFLKLIGEPILYKGNRWTDLPLLHPNYLKLREILNERLASGLATELQSNDKTVKFSARSKTIFGKEAQILGTVFLLHDITQTELDYKASQKRIFGLVDKLSSEMSELEKTSSFQKNDFRKIFLILSEIYLFEGRFLYSQSLKLEKVNPTHFIKALLEKKFTNSPIRTVFETGTNSWILVDTDKIEWIFSVLMIEAFYQGKPDQEIILITSEKDGIIHFTFSFSPLKQNTLDQLLGEGLSLIRGLIDSHDGTIEIASVDENKSSIHINMPVYSD